MNNSLRVRCVRCLCIEFHFDFRRLTFQKFKVPVQNVHNISKNILMQFLRPAEKHYCLASVTNQQ